MESEGVSIPLFHEHLMMPLNDLREGDCCGGFEVITDGYYCKNCDFFVHKKCGEFSESIQHPSHSIHKVQLKSDLDSSCDLCGKDIVDLCYNCEICGFNMDLCCAKYPPPEVIDVSEMHEYKHHHKLTLLKEKKNEFDCGAKCGKSGYGFPYKCDECDLAFHVDCVWHLTDMKHLFL